MRCPQFALCTALLLAWPPGGLWAADASPLFSSHKEAVEPRSPSQSLLGGAPDRAGELAVDAFASQGASRAASVVRSRVAEVNFGRLATAHSEVSLGRSHRLGLNLFSSGEFDAVLERSASTASGYTLTGRLADQPLSTVVLAVNGEWVAGDVWGPDGRYAIRPLGGGVAEVRQMDPAALGRCGVGMDVSEGAEDLSPPEIEGPTRSPSLGRPALSRSAPMSETLPEDDGGVIDLLVVYPSFARRSAGGHRAMRALIDSDVAMANEAYRVGGAMQRLNLVAAVEARRTPLEIRSEGMLDALRHLEDPSSGYLDEASGLRDSYAADLVLVHWGDLVTRGLAGVANKLDSPSLEPGDLYGLSVSTSSRAFVHELGHNMGLNHQRGDDFHKSNRPFPYSYGHIGEIDPPSGEFHILGRFGTIMSTLGLAVPRFSNPHQHYPDESGVPIGIPGDEPSQSDDGPADAVRSLNGTRRTVANYRRSASRCSYELSVPPAELPVSGGEFRIGVRAGSGCIWNAWSNDGFVSVLDGASGVGDGEVVVRVSANEGWEREVAVFVAGEAHLAEQATAKARRETPACNRAAPVRDALAEATGKPCGEIGAEDLASIRTLDLAHRHTFSPLSETEDRRLEPGDFDGLTGLVSLVLSYTNLAELAPGAFDGLVRLVSLDLRDNELEELVSGTFTGLPSLVTLELGYNPRLTTLEPGAFRGLSNVEELNFSVTGLTGLSAGVFEGLSNLFRLDFGARIGYLNDDGYFLEKVPLAKVEPGAFLGLSRLGELLLNSHSFTALQPGVFDGLPNLRDLFLSNNSGLTTLKPGVFDGLPNLRGLRIARNEGLKELQPGVFRGLSNLRFLALPGNSLTAQGLGLLDDLAELKGLDLEGNKLKTLEPNAFHSLPALTQLSLIGNQIRTLKPGVFDGLGALESLHLDGNELHALEPGVFDGLPNMWWLDFSENKLATVHPDLFRGLNGLRQLELDGNQLTALPPDLFRGLGQLWYVDLSRNRLRTVPPGLFDDQRSRMDTIKLGGNRLASLDPGLFRGMADMNSLQLSDNALATLPPRIFNGLYGLLRMDLTGNPGAPFAFRPEFVRAEGSSNAGGAVEVALALPEGAAFDLRIGLAVSGGSLSADESLIRVGRDRSEAVAVARDGAGPVTVRMVEVSEVPGPPCEEIFYAGFASHCWKGVRTAVGAPLVLFGLPDQTLEADSAVRFDLPSAFPDFSAGTTFAVELVDPAVVEATIAGGLLTVASTGTGATTVTVAATDPDGPSTALNFTVTVEQAANSYWGGWRSVLLQSPSPSEEGDGS